MQESNRFARVILDALASPAAVLDETGVVLAANRAWLSDFTQPGFGAGMVPGRNYLQACETAGDGEDVDGTAIAAGIRQVIAGERALFRYDYACRRAAQPCWFALSAAAVGGDAAARAVISQEDISEGRRAQLLLAMEHAVLSVLVGADHAGEALRAVIRTMCEAQGWECGRYFALDRPAGVLRFQDAWCVPAARVERFLEKSRGKAFRSDAGLVGRVCQSGQPLWLLDGLQEGELAQTALAPETGGEGAFVLPVTLEDQVIGVLAFSGRHIREPDDRMLRAVQSIGRQLGRFVQRQAGVDALRRGEQRLRSLNRLTCDWYWEQDRNFRFTEMAGGSPFGAADVLGLTPWELPDVAHAEMEWAIHRSQLAAGWSFCDLELVMIRADGERSYYSVCGEPVYDESGQFAGYCGTGLDITARKRTELALRECEARLQAAGEGALISATPPAAPGP